MTTETQNWDRWIARWETEGGAIPQEAPARTGATLLAGDFGQRCGRGEEIERPAAPGTNCKSASTQTSTNQCITAQEYIDWAVGINSRWICHDHLPQTAARWMEHLRSTSPWRLAASAQHAYNLVIAAGNESDPKPWFYAGLFSLSSREEQNVWLSSHPFTAAAVGGNRLMLLPSCVSEDTANLLIRIQSALNAEIIF